MTRFAMRLAAIYAELLETDQGWKILERKLREEKDSQARKLDKGESLDRYDAQWDFDLLNNREQVLNTFEDAADQADQMILDYGFQNKDEFIKIVQKEFETEKDFSSYNLEDYIQYVAEILLDETPINNATVIAIVLNRTAKNIEEVLEGVLKQGGDSTRLHNLFVKLLKDRDVWEEFKGETAWESRVSSRLQRIAARIASVHPR